MAACRYVLLAANTIIMPRVMLLTGWVGEDFFAVGTQKFNNHFRRRRLPFVPSDKWLRHLVIVSAWRAKAGNHFLYHQPRPTPGRHSTRSRTAPATDFPNNVPAILRKVLVLHSTKANL